MAVKLLIAAAIIAAARCDVKTVAGYTSVKRHK